MTSLLMLTALFAAEPIPAVRHFDLRTGEAMTLDALADELARADVVFLGEDHDNAAGHASHHALIAALRERRPDLVLSLEMFERDVQGLLDDYLRGRIDEAAFLAGSRPWTDYAEFYRPFIEFARSKKLDVIASNVPRRIAATVSKGDEPTLDDRRLLPRMTTTPHDAYRERFAAVMAEHAGADSAKKLDLYYRSQCLKDDAMAEAIADHLAGHRHRRPLVVHVCGRFHSDHGQGTVQRVLQRAPLLATRVVTMEAVDESDEFDPQSLRDRGHFAIVVPPPPKKSEEPEKSKR